MKIICLTVFFAIVASAFADNKIVCYYESWATYRPGEGKYTIQDINLQMCTHVIYSFIGINKNGAIKLLDDARDLTKFTKYIKSNSNVKALVSIGGASEGSAKFSTVVSNSNVRQKFVKNAVAFLKKYNFDGLDVDWEYPNQGSGSHKSDKQNFVELLKELKQAFSKKNYILSVAVGAEADLASKSYLISSISKYLDFINIMTYDFNDPGNSYTGMNSPLYASSKDNDYQKTLNVNAAVRYWLSQGAPANKIIVGVPFYGITFTLKDASNHGLHAKTTGPGKAGPYTAEAGSIGYNELCVDLKKSGWHVVRDEQEKVPYAYNGKQWISYDDAQSVREKAKFIKSLGLGGAMVWSIDTDDFRGNCGKKYPLLSTLHDVLKNCK
ncbi:Acidic mammalian chitinase [Anthophora quadrimaculata]